MGMDRIRTRYERGEVMALTQCDRCNKKMVYVPAIQLNLCSDCYANDEQQSSDLSMQLQSAESALAAGEG